MSKLPVRGGLLAAATILILACGGGGTEADTTAAHDSAVVGRVLDASGTPLADAIVELCSEETGECATGRATPDGAFRIPADRGAFTLQVVVESASHYFSGGQALADDASEASRVVVLGEGDRDLGKLQLPAAPDPDDAAAPARTPTPQPTAAGPELEPLPTRVRWLEGEWFLLGVNVPWVSWSCDFGVPHPNQPDFCDDDAGVASTSTRELVAPRFSELQQQGVHVIRWWVFPANPWQILRDEEGHPSELADSVYKDFDAALALAEQYDLYVVFTLFSSPSSLPVEWRTDPEARELLAESLRPLFARYAGNDRVLTWQVFNEPEWDIQNHIVSLESTRATVAAIAAAVHDSSDAYVSVASASLEGTSLWLDLGLDYYTAHWYDPMTGGGCAICTDLDGVQRREQIDAPLVIGEYFELTGDDAVRRLNQLYERGYAGAWAWSLFPEFTADAMAVDLEAMGEFAAERDDVGP